MVQQQEHRRQEAADQQATSLARGQAAVQHDRLHARARQTQAQLAATQHAQHAQQMKVLNTDRPAPLSMQ